MKALLLPPASLFLVAALGWALRWRWRRLGNGLIVGAALVLVALSLPVTSGWLMQPLEIYPPLDTDRVPADVQAIVILSGDSQPMAPEYGADIPGPLTLERVRYGAYLQRHTGKPVLVSGGLIRPDTTSLARQMSRVLTREFGVPVTWIEDRSLDTHQNALYSSRILKQAGITRVLLVTHAWHMRRAMAAFRATGLEPIAAPTRFVRAPTPILQDFVPDASALRGSVYAIHEWIGLLWYYVVGYTTTFS